MNILADAAGSLLLKKTFISKPLKSGNSLVTRDFLCPIPGSSRHSWFWLPQSCDKSPGLRLCGAQSGPLWFLSKVTDDGLIHVLALSNAAERHLMFSSEVPNLHADPILSVTSTAK